jgi:hypothetical protein
MDSGQVSHSDRILSALLTEMDGMGGKVQEEFSSGTPPPIAGLWIRIDLIQIRIQHFCSIRIRIQAKTELSKAISFSNFVEIKI